MSHRLVLELFVIFRLNLALVQLRNSCYKNPLYSHLSEAVDQADVKAIVPPSSRNNEGFTAEWWEHRDTQHTGQRPYWCSLAAKKDTLVAMMMQVHRTRVFIVAMS